MAARRNLTSLEQLAKIFVGVEQVLERNLKYAVLQAAQRAADHARTDHTYKDQTSQLTNSIEPVGPEGSVMGNDLNATVSAGAPHASYVEKGTRPHTIKPRYRKSLRWPVAGGYAFAGAVQHPGTAPTHFLELAVEKVLPEFQDELLPRAIELAFIQAGFTED
jgi:hypothetical protein